MSLQISRFYDDIRSLVPAEVTSALDQQVPLIERHIDEEVDRFGKDLTAFVQQELDSARTQQEAAMAAMHADLGKLIEGIPKGAEGVGDAVAALKTGIDAYEKRWKGVGEQLRTVVTTAVKRAVMGI